MNAAQASHRQYARRKQLLQWTFASEPRAQLWPLLQQGGHVYVCGGTSMGRDVVAALQAAIADHGKLTDDAAAKYVKEMQAKGRLVQELWS